MYLYVLQLKRGSCEAIWREQYQYKRRGNGRERETGKQGGYQSVAMADKSREPSLLFLLNSIAERIKKLFFRAFVEGVLK